MTNDLSIERTGGFERALSGLDGHSGIVVTGSPGTGKTHLGRRLAEHVRAGQPETSVQFLSGIDGDCSTLLDAPTDGAHPTPVIVFDDLDLIDGALGSQLVSDCRNNRIRLIATATSLKGTLSRLVRDGVLYRHHLEPFDHLETAELVCAILDGPVSADVIWWVWQTSTGNPRYAKDLVESARADGHLVRSDGTWLLTRTPRPSSGLLEMVEADLSPLGPDERDLVDVVALSRVARLEDLVAFASPGVLDGQVKTGLVVVGADAETGQAVATLNHRRFSDIAAMLVPPIRRRELFGRFYFESTLPENPSDTLVHGALWALSCAVELDVDVLLRAARAATALGQLDTTDHITTAILRRLDDAAPRRVETLLLRSDARRLAGRATSAAADADAAYEALARLDATPPSRCMWSLQVALTRANLAQFDRGDTDTALALMDAARTELTANPRDDLDQPTAQQIEAQLIADRSVRLAYAGDFGGCTNHPIPPPAKEMLPVSQQAELSLVQAFAQAYRGALYDTLTIARELAGAAEALGDDAPWALMQAQSLAFMVLVWLGDTQSAHALTASVDDNPDMKAWIDPAVRQIGRGQVAAAGRDFDGAVAEFTAAQARFQLIDFSGWLPACLTWKATALAGGGDIPRAARTLRAARALPLRASGLLTYDLWDHWCRVAIAIGAADAEQIAWSLISKGQNQGLALVELWGWHLLALANPSEVNPDGIERLNELDSSVQGKLPRARAVHARALATGDQALVATSFVTLNELGYWIPVAPGGSAAVLTDRQLRVARLAASGLSSAQIAQRLFISKRTVDAHLTNIYDRLGVHRRSELATVLASTSPE